MEKIYMESNNRKRKKIDGVSLFAFVVAIFAIVSLVAVGFNQVSFATNSVQGDDLIQGEFDVKTEDEKNNKLLSDKSFPIMRHFAEVSCTDEGNGCVAGKKTIPIYCLQREKDTVGTKYNLPIENSEIEDVGLIYLMANLYPNVEMEPSFSISGDGDNNDHKIETWISQALIWVYLKETGLDPTSQMNDDLKNKVLTSTYIQYGEHINEMNATKIGYTSQDHILVDSYKVKGSGLTARQVYEKAMQLHGQSESYNFEIIAEGEESISDDEDYYFSKALTVQGNVVDSSIAEFKDFTVRLPEDAPEGTIITDVEGNEIKTSSNLSPGTKFYIRVPVDSIDDVTEVNISVIGNFNVLAANRFVATGGDYQELTALRNLPTGSGSTYTFELAPAPDTGSSMAQTIYFIGLIVLLCGVGIVYANAKNTKVKE